jgi:hypothetical protein
MGSPSTCSLSRTGERYVHGERHVDELERRGREVEVICDLLDRALGDVVSKESPTRQRTVDLAEKRHKLPRPAALSLTCGDELGKVCSEDFLLDGQVGGDCLVGEERHEASTVLGVSATLKENPGIVAQDVLCDGDDTGFGIGGRLEDLVGKVAVGG